MKYLKPHPINESVDSDIKHDIEDILLDLNDKGIWTNVFLSQVIIQPLLMRLKSMK